MTIQFEKTKATLDLLRLEIKEALERLEEILDQISEREKKIDESKTQGDTRGRNSRPRTAN